MELSAEGAALLIKAAAKYKILKLKFSNLEVEFAQKVEPIVLEYKDGNKTYPHNQGWGEPSQETFQFPNEPRDETARVSPEIDLEDENSLKDQHAAELMITDPLAFEEHLAKDGIGGINGVSNE